MTNGYGIEMAAPADKSQGVADLETGITSSNAASQPTQQSSGQDNADIRFSCVYFGYASNLSPRTMKQRCPDSLFVGLAILKGWRWQINETGYGNIVPSTDEDVVYGSLCFLSQREEAAFDESEGVPWMYEKKKVKVRRLIGPEEEAEWGTEADEVEAMTYVDVKRTSEGRIEKDYVVWIKKAIEDGIRLGMPANYAEKYLTKYFPDRTGPEADIMMIRTMHFGEKSAAAIPRGFASWSRG